MSLDSISHNPVVTGSDGGRGAANLNYILYLVGFFLPITPIIGVALAYSNRDSASTAMRSHFDWQIRIFWRSIKFMVALAILYFIITVLGVLTFGIGFILYVIPFAVGLWWLISTVTRIARGMKALGLGQPVGRNGRSTTGDPTSAPPSPAPVTSPPQQGIQSAELPQTGREAAVIATAVEPTPAAAPAAIGPSASEPASETSSQAARFCGNCGAQRRPSARFCTSCGQA